jgi:hypothetical protein
MPQAKTFDCVEMKNQVQARLAEEYTRLGKAEQERRLRDELEHSDDVVARKWQRLIGRAVVTTR